MRDHKLFVRGSAGMFGWVDENGDWHDEHIKDFDWSMRPRVDCVCGETFEAPADAREHMVEVGDYDE